MTTCTGDQERMGRPWRRRWAAARAAWQAPQPTPHPALLRHPWRPTHNRLARILGPLGHLHGRLDGRTCAPIQGVGAGGRRALAGRLWRHPPWLARSRAAGQRQQASQQLAGACQGSWPLTGGDANHHALLQRQAPRSVDRVVRRHLRGEVWVKGSVMGWQASWQRAGRAKKLAPLHDSAAGAARAAARRSTRAGRWQRHTAAGKQARAHLHHAVQQRHVQVLGHKPGADALRRVSSEWESSAG